MDRVLPRKQPLPGLSLLPGFHLIFVFLWRNLIRLLTFSSYQWLETQNVICVYPLSRQHPKQLCSSSACQEVGRVGGIDKTPCLCRQYLKRTALKGVMHKKAFQILLTRLWTWGTLRWWTCLQPASCIDWRRKLRNWHKKEEIFGEGLGCVCCEGSVVSQYFTFVCFRPDTYGEQYCKADLIIYQWYFCN